MNEMPENEKLIIQSEGSKVVMLFIILLIGAWLAAWVFSSIANTIWLVFWIFITIWLVSLLAGWIRTEFF